MDLSLYLIWQKYDRALYFWMRPDIKIRNLEVLLNFHRGGWPIYKVGRAMLLMDCFDSSIRNSAHHIHPFYNRHLNILFNIFISNFIRLMLWYIQRNILICARITLRINKFNFVQFQYYASICNLSLGILIPLHGVRLTLWKIEIILISV